MQIAVQKLTRLHILFKSARALLKHMGEQAGVDIEPDAQSRLADATDSLAGVLCALVPGAGGVDALVAIVLSEDVRTAVDIVVARLHRAVRETVFICLDS